MNNGPSSNAKWLYDSPNHSDVEAKLRRLLVELGNADKILGIQVCAYKDGQVIIDTVAGVMGEDDPRPVQPDTLFPGFSETKGVTGGMIHWLADKGKLKLDENVAKFWPEFGTNGKDQIKTADVCSTSSPADVVRRQKTFYLFKNKRHLNHASGLHNALAGISENDTALFCDFDECVKRIAMVAPETEPGLQQIFHYMSYGWLCGGIIEHASGKKFQDILKEAFVRPLNVEGELYIGIPPGVESRLATVTYDKNEFSRFATIFENSEFRSQFAMASTLSATMVSGLIPLSNTLNVRRAILPAANGHFSARALARYYAALVDGGTVPPCHSSLLPHASHPHHPTFTSKKTSENLKDSNSTSDSHTTDPKSDLYIGILGTDDRGDEHDTKIFTGPKSKIHDALLGSGDYKDLTVPNGKFGFGFRRVNTNEGSLIGFGHAGLGGSLGYCDINNRFSFAVTINKLSFAALTTEIVRFRNFVFLYQ